MFKVFTVIMLSSSSLSSSSSSLSSLLFLFLFLLSLPAAFEDPAGGSQMQVREPEPSGKDPRHHGSRSNAWLLNKRVSSLDTKLVKA